MLYSITVSVCAARSSLAREIQPKRDRLVHLVRKLGMIPTVPDGGYFLLADFSHLGAPALGAERRVDTEIPRKQLANITREIANCLRDSLAI